MENAARILPFPAFGTPDWHGALGDARASGTAAANEYVRQETARVVSRLGGTRELFSALSARNSGALPALSQTRGMLDRLDSVRKRASQDARSALANLAAGL